MPSSDQSIIFETLNGHGAELHATDLIRNFIFMRAGNDAAELYTNLWSQFESPLWSESQSRGRLNRPRLEWFVQTAVQAERYGLRPIRRDDSEAASDRP